MGENGREDAESGPRLSAPLRDPSYPDDVTDGQHPMNVSAMPCVSSPTGSRSDTAPIHWGWWGVGLIISVGLWAGVALIMGWI